MTFSVGQDLHGFILKDQKFIEELQGNALRFVHEKSGARLLYLQNEDDNKTFSIAFRTPPENSNGLPHILEHSVLCGSEKFPTKEPFVDLIKGSLNTFLNAMTSSDKTTYPLASRNDKDFQNLMDVYLDAVFFPQLHHTEQILEQEGWHYELQKPEDELTINGVVYNEMKGAFSSADGIIYRKIQQYLFPDTPYGNESGGDPEVIPTLTQAEFTAFHQKYYHPSNGYIVLYGNGDIEKHLAFIDAQYLNRFDKMVIDSSIPMQKPFAEPCEVVEEYAISSAETEQDKTFFSMNFVTGEATDPELYYALDILAHFLMQTAAAPLRKALVEAQIGQDVSSSFDTIQQPIFSIIVKNSNPDQKEKLKEVVFSTLQKLVKEGIDPKLIEASLNRKEFSLREADYRGFPKGLLYTMKVLDSWLYEAEPTVHLEFSKAFAHIRSQMHHRYFENLIEKYLLNNTHQSLVTLQPQKGLAEAKAAELQQQLADVKSALSEAEIQAIIERTQALKKRQQTPDNPEDVAKIPLLELSDIRREAEKLPLEETEVAGTQTLLHPVYTNKIGYLNLYFDSAVVAQDELPYLALLANMLGKMDTQTRNYTDLTNEINIHTGGIGFQADYFESMQQVDCLIPKFKVTAKALIDKMPTLVEFLQEIMTQTQFTDKKRLKDILQQLKSRMEQEISFQGHMVAFRRLGSYFSRSQAYNETLNGLTFYHFVRDLVQNFEAQADTVIEYINRLFQRIFNRKNLLLSFTGDQDDCQKLQDWMAPLLQTLPNQELPVHEYQFAFGPRNEGLIVPGKVQYVVKGFNFKKLNFAHSGLLNVARKVIGLDYLWNRVRVQGGAYGAFVRNGRSGLFQFGSYRDPKLAETLQVYDETPDFVRAFTADDREMRKYIIGTFADFDYPLTPSMKGEQADLYYLSDIRYEDLQQERDAALATRPEDIQQLAEMIEAILQQNHFCVVGSESQIQANKDRFEAIVNVFA